MSCFHCLFCNIKLKSASYKQRKVHLRGKKHQLMRKTFYYEILEHKTIRNEINEKIIQCDRKPSLYELPPIFENSKILPIIPEIPKNIKNFVIPYGFTFEDERNYPKNMEKIKKVIDGEFY